MSALGTSGIALLTIRIRIKKVPKSNNHTLKKPRKFLQLMNNHDDVRSLEWSPWLDFDHTNIGNIPESKGVYKLHANMRILFIGSGQNLRQSLTHDLTNPCINKGARFSYAVTESADKIRENLLNEYRNKHDGKSPLCMEQ
ncbi:MAG: hypothetical protein QOK88_06300 [Nitrososphaeraceae archaeon]|nr:hypothetical protein [Nitrososphaeraceae archaeon]